MSFPTFMALVLFAFTMTISPGPNNTMLFASGVNFGFRRTLPHMAGILLGGFGLMCCVGFGLGAFLVQYPVLYTGLKIVGGLYLVWIAIKIGRSRSLSEARQTAKPMSFFAAVAFQWVNPKAWITAMTAVATYTNPQAYLPSFMIVTSVLMMMNIPSVATWAGFGLMLRHWLSDPVRLKWFNITMASLLVLSLYPMLR